MKGTRKGQVIGGVSIPPRPMLSIPKLDQPIQLVLNQEKAAHLGIKIQPLSEDADDDTAEVLQGLYRRIEVDSRANLARSWAFERAVKAGRGVYEVSKEWDPDAGHPFDQKIVIKRLLQQGAAYFDPSCQEPDCSDGLYAFKTEDLPLERYKAKYAKSKLAEMDDDELTGLLNEIPDWVIDTDEGKVIRVAHYWDVELRDQTISDPGDPKRTRTQEQRAVFSRVLNGMEWLNAREEWDGKYIPLIPVIGRELQPFDGQRRFVGIIEPAMDGQRLFNYAASNAVEIAALEPKAPFLGVEGQFEGHETEWQQANIRNFPYLQYRNVNLNGTPAPPPQRSQIDAGRLGPSMMLLQEANNFIQAATSTFDPSLGKHDSKDRSGRAVLAQQKQGEESTSHYLDNLAEISLTYEAKVILDLIPHVYDRPGRVARILDIEDNSSTVMLNQPFMVDPKTKRPRAVQQPPQAPQAQGMPPMSQAGQAPPDVKHFDLTTGVYGVDVSVGKAYHTRAEQGADELGQLFQAEPQLFGILGDIYLKFRDFPGHMEAAERVKKMLPPPLQDQKDANSAQQEAAQLKAQLQQMQMQMQEMSKALETDKVKVDGEIQKATINADKDLKIQEMRNAATIAVAQINAAAKGVLIGQEAQNEAQATGRAQAHEAALSAADAAHERQLAQMQHAQALELGAQAGVADAALAEQGQGHALAQGDQAHSQALEQGQQGHQQTLEQTAQAAALAPPPANGSGA